MRRVINKIPRALRGLHKPNKEKIPPHTCVPRLRSDKANLRFDAYAYRKKLRADNAILSVEDLERLVLRGRIQFERENKNRLVVHPYAYCGTCGRIMKEVTAASLIKIAQEQRDALSASQPMYQEVKPAFETLMKPFESQ